MNMASIEILLFIFTLIYISAGNAFINVQCKTENVGQYGRRSLLECNIHTGKEITDVKILVVTWKKVQDETALVVFDKGATKLRPGYSFAEPSWNDRNMNVSLLITNTAVEHEGNYKCVVMTDSGVGDTTTSLNVTAKYSKPTIQSTPKSITRNTNGILTCESDGYPKGQLRWFDKDNMEWTESSKMEAKLTESGLFHLSSNLSLLQGSIFSKYTCVVFNASGGKENEATFEVPNKPETAIVEKLNGLGPASKIVAPLVVIGSLIVGLLIVVLLYRRRSQQARRHSTAPLMGDHQGVHTCELDAEEGGHQEMDTEYKHSLA